MYLGTDALALGLADEVGPLDLALSGQAATSPVSARATKETDMSRRTDAPAP